MIIGMCPYCGKPLDDHEPGIAWSTEKHFYAHETCIQKAKEAK